MPKVKKRPQRRARDDDENNATAVTCVADATELDLALTKTTATKWGKRSKENISSPTLNDKEKNSAAEQKLSVLLVEDDVPTLLEVQAMLIKAGATKVFTASSGKKALEFLGSGEDVDLIFADIMMPECDIEELKSVLKKNEKLKNCTVIVMSTVGSQQQHEYNEVTDINNNNNNNTRASKRLRATTTTTTTTTVNNFNMPQTRSNSNEVLLKPLSFRRVENVVCSHQRLLRSHNSSSSENEKQTMITTTTTQTPKIKKKHSSNDCYDGRGAVTKTQTLLVPTTTTAQNDSKGSGDGSGTDRSGPTTVKLIHNNNESSEEDLRKITIEDEQCPTAAVLAPTTTLLTTSDEKAKNVSEDDEMATIVAAMNKGNAIIRRNNSPPLDQAELDVRRVAATVGNERRRKDEKRWLDNRTHTRDDGDGSDEGSGAGSRNRSRSFSDDKVESDLKQQQQRQQEPTVTRKKRSLRGGSSVAEVAVNGGGQKVIMNRKDGDQTEDLEGKQHLSLAVQLMNEHDDPTALLQLALAGSVIDTNSSLRRSRSTSAFHSITEKTQQQQKIGKYAQQPTTTMAMTHFDKKKNGKAEKQIKASTMTQKKKNMKLQKN